MTQIDDILYELLRDQMDKIKSDPAVLDIIFEGKPKEAIEQVRKFILENKAIRIVFHHPRVGAEFPCLSVVLESSAEGEQVIGAALYDEQLVSNMDDGWIGSDSNIFIANIPLIWAPATTYALHQLLVPTEENGRLYECMVVGISGSTEPVWSTSLGSSVTDGTVEWVCRTSVISDPKLDVNQFYSALEVRDGRRSCHMIGQANPVTIGKGITLDLQNSVLQGGFIDLVDMNRVTFLIKSIRLGTFLSFGLGKDAAEDLGTFPITLQERKVWERVNLDISKLSNRDKKKIRYLNFKITNADSLVDVYIDALKGEKEYGSTMNETFLDHRYRIEVWSENVDLTLAYYNILLWTLLRYRDYLETTWALMEQRVEGGDIMPQPEYYPEMLYVRALMFNCKTIEAVPRETDLVALEVKLGRQDWGLGH